MSTTQQLLNIGDGVSLAFWDIGQGDPVVLLHGFTGTAVGHLGRLLDSLSASHRVIAPDLRGYGASRPPNRDFPADFYARDARDVAALLDALGVRDSVIMGFSDGAEVAVLLAALRPDLVRGVVAWGVSGVISPEQVSKVQDWLPVSDWGTDRDEWREKIIERHGIEQLEPMIAGWVHAAEAIANAGGNICLNEAAQIACPVLLLNGVAEVGNVPRDAIRLCAAIPNCQLVFIEDCGHPIQDDQPELLEQRIDEFLKSLQSDRDAVTPASA